MNIELFDADINLNPGIADTITIDVISSSDPQGETVTLTTTAPDISEFPGSVDVQEGSGGSGYLRCTDYGDYHSFSSGNCRLSGSHLNQIG